MALTYTAEQIIDSLRLYGVVPDTGSQGTQDADLLRHLNEEMSLRMIPKLIEEHAEYYVTTTRIALVSNTLKYRLPSRAFMDKLRFISYVDSNGERDSQPLVEISPERRGDYDWSTTSRPSGYYLEGNYICVVGSSFSGWLEISWFFRPGQLVKSTEARQVTAVDLVTKTVTFATNVPASWSTTNLFDVHSKNSGAEVKVWDAAATTVSGTSIVFTAAIDGTTIGTHPIEVGDWVCLAEEAVVPAIPKDMHPMLVESTTVRVMAAKGDAEAVRIHSSLLEAPVQSFKNILENRVESKPTRIRGHRGLLWRQRL